MAYLSRIRINPLRSESRRLLDNPRAMHAAVTGGTPEAPSGERALWRLDADNPHRPHLLVLTPSRPDWTHIIEQAGWPDADGEHAVVRDYAPLLAQLAAGRRFAFRLTASPVQNTRTPAKPTPEQAARLTASAGEKRIRSFRLGHRTAAAQLDWFLSRTHRWGFTVPAFRTDQAAPGLDAPARTPGPAETTDRLDADPGRDIRITAHRRHSFTKNGNGPRVTFHSVTYEGSLCVTDPEALTTHLLRGIGPSKAYGCGLLTLSPLHGHQS